MSYQGNDIGLYHQLRIARKTMKMSDVGASIMGGMTKDEARAILAKERMKNKQKKSKAKK